MTHAKEIEKLKTARALIKEAVAGLSVPMIESALAEADMNLHWALWNLGEEVELLPETVNS
jgi:hypothetical protein